ncbi:MAG: ABC transporter permease subunit [Desulfovibrio sp.]|uniref:amino acid ABC transporter permease n=1 Tax=Desulfovibrio sp. 7SRBS1 TaxID=3378064 RepID=UPI003B410CE7
MRQRSGLDRPRSPMWYAMWKAAFVIIVIGGVLTMWAASESVEYIWRWNRVPQYFWTDATVDVRAEIEGDVSSITKRDGSNFITISGPSNQETYNLHKGEPLVYEGDMISPGDVLGSYRLSQPGIMLEGLWLTLKISFIAIIFGIFLGVLTGLMRISRNPCFRWLSITYIEIIRGSPLLVQIFLWYFVMGTLINSILDKYGIGHIPPLWYGVIALAIFTGAYTAEIVRAGIQSVHRGQMEAARSLGMSSAQAMRKVILPQAFRRIMPPLAGQFISLIKDSSLLGVIAIRELTKATREIVTSSLQPFEMWIVCACLYLVLTFTLSLFVQYLERRAVIR